MSSKQGDKLTALDTESGKVIHEISLSPAPYHLNTINGTGKVYVSSRKEPKIWIVDQETLKVTGEIALPGGEGHQIRPGLQVRAGPYQPGDTALPVFLSN